MKHKKKTYMAWNFRCKDPVKASDEIKSFGSALVDKLDGHSSYEQAIQVAEMAGVKQLAITHHDPDHDDEFLTKMEKQCQQRFKDCFLVREKMEIEL